MRLQKKLHYPGGREIRLGRATRGSFYRRIKNRMRQFARRKTHYHSSNLFTGHRTVSITKSGYGGINYGRRTPLFLQADVLNPFINKELHESTKAVFYRTLKGGKGVGYEADLLPKVAEVYLRYRDHCMVTTGEVPERYEHIIKAADILIRGLAHIGIIALVDEATGYQKNRAKN